LAFDRSGWLDFSRPAQNTVIIFLSCFSWNA